MDKLPKACFEKNGDANTLDMIRRMGSQVNKFAALVQEILDFTKTQQGKLMYNETFFDF
jgi:hypothetical protein